MGTRATKESGHADTGGKHRVAKKPEAIEGRMSGSGGNNRARRRLML
jgi:hypothetical protein